MTSWHEYPVETRAALAALSRGSCYFPGCRTPILISLDGRPVVNVEITHIRADQAGRPRFVPGLSRESVNAFGNLLLLCVPHRKTIDRDEQTHPVDLLATWIPRREVDGRDALTALGEVTADRLDELLTTAFRAVRDQIAEALSRFEKADPDSAHLLRTLVDDLSDQSRSGADPGAAGARALISRQLSALEDHAADLRKAADELRTMVGRRETTPTRTNVGWTTET